jgi:hypothetical protein
MNILSLLIGIAVGLVLAGIGVSGAKILTWVEAKIKLVEAQTASHQAVTAVTNARAQILKGMPTPSAPLAPSAPSAPSPPSTLSGS